MKKFMLMLVLGLGLGFNVFASEYRSAELRNWNFDSDLSVGQQQFHSGTIVIDQFEKNIRLEMYSAHSCEGGGICLSPVTIASVALTKMSTDRCGVVTYSGEQKLQASKHELQVKLNSMSVCDRTALAPTEIYYVTSHWDSSLNREVVSRGYFTAELFSF